ncbi:MAG: hypothetical protein HY815_03595, partial [Candidatus Riflebacteria bacterium]|nr:hypothetical protein [Candidatus Riflebacteria bacterium]
ASPLIVEPGRPIQNDKWAAFTPGKGADATGTLIDSVRGAGDTFQEVVLKAALVDRETGQIPASVFDKTNTGYVVLRLKDVSKYPGIAGNKGFVDDRLNDTYDMSLKSKGGEVTTHEPSSTSDPIWSTVLVVKDYAATATIEGRTTINRLEPPTAKVTQRDLPVDTDGDDLSDSWEREVTSAAAVAPSLTTLNATLDSDEDRFQQSLIKGDGLSAFEEYRGFFVEGKHRRTNELQDDTPTGGKSTVGDANRGGPFRKDVFIHDPNKLFSTYGLLTTTYGASVHLITTGESFVPMLGQDKPFEGQINRMTPTTPTASLDHRVPGIIAQYRLKLVDTVLDKNQNSRYYGSSGADWYRDAAPVEIDTKKLTFHLGHPDWCNLKSSDWRYKQAVQRVLAHEMGHRFTLRHPLLTVPITSVLPTSSTSLTPGVLAAFLPDGSGLRVRAIAEVRELRPGQRRYLALRQPVDLTLAPKIGPPWQPRIKVDLASAKFSGPFPETVKNPVTLAGPGPGGELVTERTADYALVQKLDPAVLASIVAGTQPAFVRFHDSTWEGSPPKMRATNWMDSGGGSVFFPPQGVPPWWLEWPRMTEQRDFDLASEEER